MHVTLHSITTGTPAQMVEMCNITSLSISFCYKVCVQKLEVVFSTLRAKGSIHCLEMLGITVSPLTVEVLSFFPPSLTHLSLCGVQTLTDSMVDMVREGREGREGGEGGRGEGGKGGREGREGREGRGREDGGKEIRVQNLIHV